MIVRELITQLLNEDMDADVMIEAYEGPAEERSFVDLEGLADYPTRELVILVPETKLQH